MRTETIPLAGGTPGLRHELTVLSFGDPGAGPKAAIQAAVHADEVPALLVAQCLRERLMRLEAAGELIGEVRLVPVANPVGLGQRVLGRHEGRFDLADGLNFNRGYADLAAAALPRVEGELGADPAANVRAVRAALRQAAEQSTARTTVEHLKQRLLLNAVDCDIVLDLHCDTQAVMHVYALTPHEALAVELGAELGAQAVLLAMESGDSPFDEACSRPWVQLQERLPAVPIPPACFAATVELRGEADVDARLAENDAQALLNFLRRRGLIAGEAGALPAARCEATPLSGSEPIVAPHAGILIFEAQPGDRLGAGDAVATLVCPITGTRTVLRAQSAGVLYGRIATRWASAGQRLAKVAGRSLQRTGKLLSA